jgi:hypothetical protein
LVLNGGKQGTPFNIRLDLPQSVTDYYFKVRLVDVQGSLSIGVVTPSEFLGGWKTKGMFYNGNLTDGSAAKAVSWGPRFEAGDSVGVRVIRADGSVEVIFYVNEKSLGTAFSLVRVPEDKQYCPCLHLDGEAKVILELPQELPTKAIYEEKFTGIQGVWRLVEGSSEEGPLKVPSTSIVLHLNKEADHVRLAIKVGNPMHGNAKIVEDQGASLKIQMGPLMSGRMMPPPELFAVEQFLSKLDPDVLTLDSSDRLTLTHTDPERCSVWIRKFRTPQTLTSYA